MNITAPSLLTQEIKDSLRISDVQQALQKAIAPLSTMARMHTKLSPSTLSTVFSLKECLETMLSSLEEAKIVVDAEEESSIIYQMEHSIYKAIHSIIEIKHVNLFLYASMIRVQQHVSTLYTLLGIVDKELVLNKSNPVVQSKGRALRKEQLEKLFSIQQMHMFMLGLHNCIESIQSASQQGSAHIGMHAVIQELQCLDAIFVQICAYDTITVEEGKELKRIQRMIRESIVLLK